MLYPPLVSASLGDTGASGFFRILYPLSGLDHAGMIQLRMPNAGRFFPIEILRVMKPDSVLFHRSHTEGQIKYIRACKDKLDTNIVYTIDDWVGKVPKYSPHFKNAPKKWDSSIFDALRLSDRLIVTNKTLANVYGSKIDTYIMPNYLMERLWQQVYMTTPRRPRTSSIPRIGWSGAIGHDSDLAILKEIAEELGDSVRWVFLCKDAPPGFNPTNAELHPACETNDYPKQLYQLDLDLALAPLIDNDFNRAKSSLRILEYGVCGFPVIASNVRPYSEDSNFPVTLLPYKASEWVKVIKDKISNLTKLKEEGYALNKYVWEHYKLEDHLKEYAEIFCEDKIPFVPTKSEKTDTVDVLITTHNNCDVVKRCVESVRKSLPENSTLVNVKIYDDSTDEATLAYLKELNDIQIVRVEGDNGYIEKINKAISDSKNDVICLNSDTLVPNSNWIDRFRTNAYSGSRISSITSFTNNGTIVSYPNPQGSELKPRMVDFYDKVAREQNLNPVLIPTSVGFACYYKREALDEVGLFDSHGFGYAYGEENDWSMRATQRNWFQSAGVNIYIGHEGAVTLSSRTEQLQNQANQIMSVRWPNYFKLLEQYQKSDFLRQVRTSFDLTSIKEIELLNPQEGRTLFISHSLGGGLETHLQAILKRTPDALILRVDPQQSSMVKLEMAGETYYNLPFFNLRITKLTVLRDLFKELKVGKIYVETTYSYDYNIPYFIYNLAESMNIPYEIMLHDYYTFCPRLRMINEKIEFCGAPSEIETCVTCVKENGSALGQVDMYAWRKMYSNFLSSAKKVYAPSNYTAKMINKYYSSSWLNIDVIPHEDSEDLKCYKLPEKYDKGVLRVAVIGFLTVDKGALIIKQCAEYAEKYKLPIQFVVVGDLIDANAMKIQENKHLKIMGAYKEESITEILSNIKCHMSLFVSQWPETYSYTLSHAFKAGLWPIAIDCGAIGERIREQKFGTLLPYEKRNDIDCIMDTLLNCAKWQEQVKG